MPQRMCQKNDTPTKPAVAPRRRLAGDGHSRESCLLLSFILSIFVISALGAGAAAADDPGSVELTARMEKGIYEPGEIVRISVTLSTEGNITSQVRNGTGEILLIESCETTRGNASFEFALWDGEQPGNYSIYVSGVSRDGENSTSTTVHFEVVAPPGDDDENFLLRYPAPALIGVTGLAAFSMLLYATEVGRYRIWLLLLVLYTRIKKEKALDDFNRGRIYTTIEDNPGIRYSEISRRLGIGNGVLTYHLDVLHKTQKVKSIGDRTLKRFYLWGAATNIPPNLEKPLAPVERSIVDFLLENEWVTQKGMFTALGVSQQAVSKNLKKMEKKKLLRRQSGSAGYEYALTEEFRKWLDRKMERKCSSCGNVCRIGARFCENCGMRIDNN